MYIYIYIYKAALKTEVFPINHTQPVMFLAVNYFGKKPLS